MSAKDFNGLTSGGAVNSLENLVVVSQPASSTAIPNARTLGVGPGCSLTDNGASSSIQVAPTGSSRNASGAGNGVTLGGESAHAGGTNLAGGALTLTGGIGTGNAAGGAIIFKTSPPGSSGTADETLVEAGRVDNLGNVVVGTAALAQSATSGFLYIPTTPGKPSGNAAAYAGLVAICFDSSGSKLSVNTTGSTWVQTAALT